MTDEFPPYEPGTTRAGQLPAGRPMALHLLDATNQMLGQLPADVLSARDVAAINLQAATVHALLALGDTLRGAGRAVTLDGPDNDQVRTLADLDLLRGDE